jgi:MscS family membrane protein
MNPFLQQTILSNSINDYLRVLAVIAIAFLLKRIVSLFFANWLYRILSKKTGNDARQSFLNLVLQPLQVFIILVVSFVALDKLNFPQVLQMKIYHSTTKEIIESAFIGIVSSSNKCNFSL